MKKLLSLKTGARANLSCYSPPNMPDSQQQDLRKLGILKLSSRAETMLRQLGGTEKEMVPLINSSSLSESAKRDLHTMRGIRNRISHEAHIDLDDTALTRAEIAGERAVKELEAELYKLKLKTARDVGAAQLAEARRVAVVAIQKPENTMTQIQYAPDIVAHKIPNSTSVVGRSKFIAKPILLQIFPITTLVGFGIIIYYSVDEIMFSNSDYLFGRILSFVFGLVITIPFVVIMLLTLWAMFSRTITAILWTSLSYVIFVAFNLLTQSSVQYNIIATLILVLTIISFCIPMF